MGYTRDRLTAVEKNVTPRRISPFHIADQAQELNFYLERLWWSYNPKTGEMSQFKSFIYN